GIPFATGGPTDTAIRVIQPQLAANLGVPVVLVNKAGGGGAVGMDGVAKAKPDGYTLAATVRSTVTILPATQPDVTYKLADFAVVGSYAYDSGVVLVKAGAPWKTPEALVDRLSAALEKTMKDPAAIAAIEKAGLTVEYHDPAATRALIERENEVVARLAKKLSVGQ